MRANRPAGCERGRGRETATGSGASTDCSPWVRGLCSHSLGLHERNEIKRHAFAGKMAFRVLLRMTIVAP